MVRYSLFAAIISLFSFLSVVSSGKAINIIQLDQSEWFRYKKIRLHAVSEAPQAFGSTYDEEILVSPEDWRRRLKFNMFFAQQGDDIIGMIGAVIDSRQKTRHTALLISFYVEPAARHQGVGSLLLSKMLQHLNNDPSITKIILKVTTTQNAVIQLYKKVGFNITGVLENEYCFNDRYYDQYIMTKWCRKHTYGHDMQDSKKHYTQVYRCTDLAGHSILQMPAT